MSASQVGTQTYFGKNFLAESQIFCETSRDSQLPGHVVEGGLEQSAAAMVRRLGFGAKDPEYVGAEDDPGNDKSLVSRRHIFFLL